MIRTTLSQLANFLDGEVFGQDVSCSSVITDTRKIISGCLFVALQGKNFDAHDFAFQAKEAGAIAILVSRKLNIDLPQLVVKNTLLAFSKIGAWVRQQVPARVVALTGSSGKTSVKEMAASILNQCGDTLYTAGNLNNKIGVPMTLVRLTRAHKYAVIELSGSRPGEIAWLSSLTRPEVALVNNLSEAHLEGFGSLECLSKAKGEIYSGLLENGIAILNADNNYWLHWRKIIGVRKTWQFSLNSTTSDFFASNLCLTAKGVEFILQTTFGSIDIKLQLLGRHNIANALAAAALTVAVGAPLTAIKSGLANLKAIPGRLFPILLTKNKLLLDDSYNASIGSMFSAMQVLSRMPGYRVMVVGDMAELGDKSEMYHVQVGKASKIFELNCVLSVGKWSEKFSQASCIGEHFSDKTALVDYLRILLKQHAVITILVKGSRSAKMEEIVYALQEKIIC